MRLSTTIRLGRGSCVGDYTGYKHLRGAKTQVMVGQAGCIDSVCGPYPAGWHDKRIFEMVAQNVDDLSHDIIGDKAYLGLSAHNIRVPEKRNHRCFKKTRQRLGDERLNRQRIVAAHTFASIKRCKVSYTGFHFTRQTLFQFLYSACIFQNAEMEFRNY